MIYELMLNCIYSWYYYTTFIVVIDCTQIDNRYSFSHFTSNYVLARL